MIHERLLCLLIVCETMFTIGESRTISNPNDTELQAQQVPANPCRGRFSIETPLENADLNSSASGSKKTTAKQRTSLSTAKAKSSTQRPQTCTEAATKYYNYVVIETDEEREDRLPTSPKATRLDQATLKVNSQNYLLRCSDRQQELCTSRISFQRLGTADQPLHHEQQWVLQ